MPDEATHFLRYGTHSEKDFFLGEFSNSYDVAMINANMLAYTPKAMSAFALRLTNPFFIDPQTHAFQHGFEFITGKNDIPKQSISNLATLYGEPISLALNEKRSVGVSDFASTVQREQFVKNVVDFQLEKIHGLVTAGAEAEYVNFALNVPESGLSKQNLSPAGVIAPYLYINRGDTKTLELNIQFIKDTKTTLGDKAPLVAQLVISKSALSDEEFREKIIGVYGETSADAVFVWVDDFGETEVSEEYLRDFKKLVVELSKKGKDVVNLYGGYFSLLLTKIDNGLKGVCHGMEYGESRKVVPVGGGLPRAKYYFRPLHKRLRSEDFRKITIAFPGWENGSKNQEFAEEVCTCKMCENLDQFAETQTYEIKTKNGLRRGEASTSAAKEHSLMHYLVNKKKEYAFVKENTLTFLVEDLKNAETKYSLSAGSENIEHIQRWVAALSL